MLCWKWKLFSSILSQLDDPLFKQSANITTYHSWERIQVSAELSCPNPTFVLFVLEHVRFWPSVLSTGTWKSDLNLSCFNGRKLSGFSHIISIVTPHVTIENQSNVLQYIFFLIGQLDLGMNHHFGSIVSNPTGWGQIGSGWRGQLLQQLTCISLAFAFQWDGMWSAALYQSTRVAAYWITIS